MNNRFIKHFFVIGSGTLISMIIGFLTTPIITRIVDPTSYGQFSIFTMYSNMALMVLYLGLDQSVVRYFYEKKTDDYRRALLFKCLKYPVIGTLITAIVVILLGSLGIFKFELGFKVLFLVCVYTLIQVIYRFSLLLVRLQYKSKMYSTLGVIQKVTYVGFALVFIYLNLFSDTIALALATMIAAFISMIISIVVERRLWNYSLVKPEDCAISQKELIRYAYPYVFSMGVTTLFQYIDKISLNIYCSYVEVGIFSSTMTLVNVFSIIQTTFNTLWAPMAIEHYTKDKNDKSFYQRGNQIITVIMFFIGFSLILVKDVFAILLGAKYRAAAYILPFLIFNPIMYTISETTVNGLVFKKKSNLQLVVSLGASIVNIIGNTILVPRLGSQGAAISTGISYIVFFTLRTVLSNKVFYVDFHLKKFYLLTACAVVYAFYNTFVPFNVFSVIGYIICIVLMVVLYYETILFGANYLKNIIGEAIGKRKK